MNIDESQTAKGFTAAPPGRTVEEIVIHHWGALGQSHDDVVKFFVSGPGATSAHFVVSAGRVTCLVSPENVAWHAGDWAENLRSIGIECHPEATDEDYAQVAELVAWLRARFNRPLPLHAHREFISTACPGVWDLGRIDALASGVQPASTPTQGEDVTPEQMYELKTFMQNEINKSINAMWASDSVIQQLIQGLGAGLNKVQAGAVDLDALAKAVNDDAAKRMQK
ncbi:MAG: peptidoglycan recognition protein family protein [Arthrobacter sp.]